MERSIMILKSLYPQRDDFSEQEEAFVDAILRASATLPKRRIQAPSSWCGVGDTLTVGGRTYRCVEVPSDTHWSEACSGCDFSRCYRNCDGVMCSKFDRKDGKFVWYQEIND